MSYWKRKSFKELQEAWYERLESDGFRDAEEMVGGELVLKQSASNSYRGADELQRGTKESYYRLLTHQLQEAEFANEVDRYILTRFAEGAKIKIICAELEGQGEANSRHRHSVRFIIRRYEVRWGLREYSPRALNKKEAS